MMYYYFPALADPFHRDSIHVASVIRSKIIKSYGSGRCLASIVQELCKLSRDDAEEFCEEIITSLRNKENYIQDLAVNNSSATGVVYDCIFNTLEYFHCNLNYSLDLMHDFFEGIFKYVICQVLLNFINRNVVKLNVLNDRINNFSYGDQEVRYIPNIIDKKHLEENNLKMTERESWQFIFCL